MDTTDHPTSIPTPPKCMHATNRPYHIFTFLMHFLAAAFSSTIALENFFYFIFILSAIMIISHHPHNNTNYLLTNL
jgi:hypothetical protein